MQVLRPGGKLFVHIFVPGRNKLGEHQIYRYLIHYMLHPYQQQGLCQLDWQYMFVQSSTRIQHPRPSSGSYALCLSLRGQDRSRLDGAIFLRRLEGSSMAKLVPFSMVCGMADSKNTTAGSIFWRHWPKLAKITMASVPGHICTCLILQQPTSGGTMPSADLLFYFQVPQGTHGTDLRCG